jgi:3-oxoacyl-[acyl-carrier-protein] synthase II
VVITGVGIVSPIGIGKEAYLDALRNGRSGANRVTYFDTTTYPCQIDAEVKGFVAENFMDKKKARRMDRFTQFAMAATRMAVADSGIDFSKENPDRCGAIVGSGIGGLQTIEAEHNVILEKGMKRVSPFLIPMLISNIAPGEIAIEYGLTGPTTPSVRPAPPRTTPSARRSATCVTATPTFGRGRGRGGHHRPRVRRVLPGPRVDL